MLKDINIETDTLTLLVVLAFVFPISLMKVVTAVKMKRRMIKERIVERTVKNDCAILKLTNFHCPYTPIFQ